MPFTLPLLKVGARPDGVLLFDHREGAFPPVDDDWWHGLLRDPRARLPRDRRIDKDSADASYRLDRQRLHIATSVAAPVPFSISSNLDCSRLAISLSFSFEVYIGD
jgi:hypothetical protein